MLYFLKKRFAKFMALFARTKVFTVSFMLRGGQTITLPGVTKITVNKGSDNRYSGYQIEWVTGFQPALFSVALDDVSAVTAVEM